MLNTLTPNNESPSKNPSTADSRPTWWQLVQFFTPFVIAFIIAWFTMQNDLNMAKTQIMELKASITILTASDREKGEAVNKVLQRLERIESKQDSSNERLRELLNRK